MYYQVGHDDPTGPLKECIELFPEKMKGKDYQ